MLETAAENAPEGLCPQCLAQGGEKILAIKLYRRVHPAFLAEAKAMVDGLAG